MPFTLATFAALDWIVVALYMALIVAVGWWTSRGQQDQDSFFLANRQMPTWAVALSVLATSLSAATFIGAPQIAYQGDLTFLSLNIGAVLAAIVVAVVFLPPLYRAGTITIYGYLGQRFGATAMIGASCAFLLGRLLASGARLFMAAIAVSLVLFGDIEPISLIIAIIIFGVIGTIYTMMGGIKAVIWTDVIQIFIVVGAALLTIALLLKAIPLSLPQIIDALRHSNTGDKLLLIDTQHDWAKGFTLWAAFATLFMNTGAYGADQDLVQRMLTARSPWRAGLSLISANLLAVPVVGLFMVIGLLLSIYYGMPELMGDAAPGDALDDSRKVYPQFLLNHLPMGMAGFAMVGLMAAAMSSFDSAVNAMASSVVNDLRLPWCKLRDPAHKAAPLGTSRWIVLVIGIVLTLCALVAAYLQQADGNTLIDFALGVMAFAHAGLLGVFLTALLTRRGNNTSVIAALIAGALTVLAVQPYILGTLTMWWTQTDEPFKLAWPWWMVIGTTISFLICIAGNGPTNRGNPNAT
jgi:SSS family solute:Na+ symporter